jgi:hypothetical protein
MQCSVYVWVDISALLFGPYLNLTINTTITVLRQRERRREREREREGENNENESHTTADPQRSTEPVGESPISDSQRLKC